VKGPTKCCLQFDLCIQCDLPVKIVLSHNMLVPACIARAGTVLFIGVWISM